jgi:hypothetical protein
MSRMISVFSALGVVSLLFLLLRPAEHVPGAGPDARHEEVDDEDEGRLEIEVTGQIHASASAARYVIYAQARPCALDHLDGTQPMGIDSLVDTGDLGYGEKVFAFEAIMDEDEHPYVCVVAFDDARRVVGFGGSGHDPVPVAREAGEEYGRAHGLAIQVRPVDPPRAIDDDALLHHSG